MIKVGVFIDFSEGVDKREADVKIKININF